MVFSVSIFASLAPYIVSALLLFLLLEQLSYLIKKRNLPGPLFVPPIIGNAVSLVRDPTSFWDKQSATARISGGLSANYLIGKFIVYIRDTELSHQIFSNVRPDAFHLVGHPFGKKLFGDHNLIYMFGEDHKSVRRHLAPNFTPKAFSTYSALQQLVILRHLRRWDESFSGVSRPVSLRKLVRELNLETSQTVFVGPYLDKEARNRFRTDYNLFNLGSMALPIDLPGFAFGEARRAVKRLAETLAVCAGKSKARMAAGEEPTCLIDFWMQAIVAENPPPPHSGDDEIGGFLFDFLFAAQDASTSSLLWAVTLLDSEPEVLSRVREEVARIWSPESNALITVDQLADMKYTRSVAREVIRFRPPATMVPHVAATDFPLTESYTIAKGTIVFPSVFDSSFQGFTEPDRFDPDRFNETRKRTRCSNAISWRLGGARTSAWGSVTTSCSSSQCSRRSLISRGFDRTAAMRSFTAPRYRPRTGAPCSCLGASQRSRTSLLELIWIYSLRQDCDFTIVRDVSLEVSGIPRY